MKLNARVHHGHFVDLQREESPYSISVPEISRVVITRSGNFRHYIEEKLPGVSGLLDGIAQESELKVETGPNGMADDMLL